MGLPQEGDGEGSARSGKIFRCYRPGCHNSYKQLSGLRYHMLHVSRSFRPPSSVITKFAAGSSREAAHAAEGRTSDVGSEDGGERQRGGRRTVALKHGHASAGVSVHLSYVNCLLNNAWRCAGALQRAHSLVVLMQYQNIMYEMILVACVNAWCVFVLLVRIAMPMGLNGDSHDGLGLE